MCGITGFFDFNGATPGGSELRDMCGVLAHRGPDGDGVWVSEDHRVGLGHTRLAIIDLESGDQPMHSHCGRFTIVFNGEIYNYASLRAELGGLGHSFNTHSDTETVIESFRRWGNKCLSRFRGMFAFALYDHHEDSLFLARDPTGMKPLYVHRSDTGLVFGSEMKALLKSSKVPRRLDLSALADFLILGFPLSPRTFFQDIEEVVPGMWLSACAGKYEGGRYWNWKRIPEFESAQLAEERTEEVLLESVRDHLVADVPVGAFLSGGIDSSLIVALATRCLGKGLQTFNVGFESQGFDESPYARAVAEHFGTEHHEIRIRDGQCDLGLMKELVGGFDQPFADSSAIPTYMLCREIRKYVKVALSGDGGDELFGGYRRFWYWDVATRLHSVSSLVSAGSQLVNPVLRKLHPGAYRSTRRLQRAITEGPADRLSTITGWAHNSELADMLNREKWGELGDYRPQFRMPSDDPGEWNEAGALIDATMLNTLHGDYLRKVDFMSSAHGLEVRVPMLGAQVLEHAARLPLGMRYNGSTNKIMLRRLADRYLPKHVARKPKAGFSIPLHGWLGEEGRSEVTRCLSEKDSILRALICPDYMNTVANAFDGGGYDEARYSRYNINHRAYMLWSLHSWLEKWNPEL